MTESPQQYSARISGYVKGLNHLKILESMPRSLGRLLKSKSRTFLTRPPGPGKWSIAEILAHLADSEIVLGYRFRLVVGSPGTPIQSFDQDVWQSNAGYLRKNPKLALALFAAAREANVAFLKSLTKEQWSRFGIHSERGEESITRMAELLAGHDVNHLKQIEAIAMTGKKNKR